MPIASSGAGHEADVGALAPAQVHPHRRERAEGPRDLLGVAQVVVEHQRDERHRGLAEAGEDPLVLVGVDVETALVLVAQRLHERVPPVVGEVLRLVDDHGVELLALGQARRRSRSSAPARSRSQKSASLRSCDAVSMPHSLREVLERPDEGRPVVPRHPGELPLEVLREPDRVADERDALRLAISLTAGQVLGLGQGEDRLAAAGPAADLHAPDEPRHRQQGGLLLGEPVGGSLALVGLAGDVEPGSSVR